jgi:hypothetical protein
MNKLRREKQMKYCIAALLALSSVVVGQEPPALPNAEIRVYETK